MYLIKKVTYSMEARDYRTQNGIRCYNLKGRHISQEPKGCKHEVVFFNKPVSQKEAYEKNSFLEKQNVGIIDYCNTYSVIKKIDLWAELRLVLLKREQRVDGYLIFMNVNPSDSIETNGKNIMRRDPVAIILLKKEEGQYIRVGDFMVEVIGGQLIQTA